MGVWLFPFSSEGKARRAASALNKRGHDDIALTKRAGIWHVVAPTDSPRTHESRSFLTGQGPASSPFLAWVA